MTVRQHHSLLSLFVALGVCLAIACASAHVRASDTVTKKTSTTKSSPKPSQHQTREEKNFAAHRERVAALMEGVDNKKLSAFGKALFFDKRLSATGTQSCSTCHDPAFGFASPKGDAVQTGADGVSKGKRAVPSLRYLQSVNSGTDCK
jgi:cytochrome c peroxidase